MKEILLQYYAKQNLGDDLFVSILSDHFSDCKINLLSNPAYVPKALGANVSVHPFSIVRSVLGKLQSLIGWNHPITHKLEAWQRATLERIISRNDAFVFIGGSIFMQRGAKNQEVDFLTDRKPVFTYSSQHQTSGKSFIIGANLGPIYTKEFLASIKSTLTGYAHVTLRDYSSYCLVNDLSHVQYAPDVIFMAQQPPVTTAEKSVVISVIDISRHCDDENIITKYYTLLRDTIIALTLENIPVVLVSFCKREGDEKAIHHLLDILPDSSRVSTHFYDGDIQAALALFSNAAFIIASRFHSMILGISFGKPVFPISYNCKTRNYLADLSFTGKFATLASLANVSYEDVLYNFKNHIITDCSLHKKYAEHQFYALRTFIDAI